MQFFANGSGRATRIDLAKINADDWKCAAGLVRPLSME